MYSIYIHVHYMEKPCPSMLFLPGQTKPMENSRFQANDWRSDWSWDCILATSCPHRGTTIQHKNCFGYWLKKTECQAVSNQWLYTWYFNKWNAIITMIHQQWLFDNLLICHIGIQCNILHLWGILVCVCVSFTFWSNPSEPRKKPSYFPLYWLFNRDQQNWFITIPI